MRNRSKLLLDNGHKKIGIAGIDSYPYTGRLRLSGYKKALNELGITPKKSWIQTGDYSYLSGEEAMRQYGKNTELTGIVAVSDMVAI